VSGIERERSSGSRKPANADEVGAAGAQRGGVFGAERSSQGIRRAESADSAAVAAILREAAAWLDERGETLWRTGELEDERIAREVEAGLFWLACSDGEPAGVVRFQLDDAVMWPDAAEGCAAYVHRLAVRRRFAGGGISRALLDFARERARALGRGLLRLDCEADRPRLRAVYERYGFSYHSDFRAGPYRVARYELSSG
jgi:GNAT superfamily N-acetyltransferase